MFLDSDRFVALEFINGVTGQPEKFELTGERIELGRDPRADIMIGPESLKTSRLHASISLSNDQFTITDLGSLNGTLINDVRITGPELLFDEDRIMLGAEGPVVRFIDPAHQRTLRAFPRQVSATRVDKGPASELSTIPQTDPSLKITPDGSVTYVPEGSELDDNRARFQPPPALFDDSRIHWSLIQTNAVFGGPSSKSRKLEANTLAPGPPVPSSGAPADVLSERDEEESFKAPRSSRLSIGPGTVLLGKYRITRHLGAGGIADIYLAVDEKLQEEVAVKIPNFDGMSENYIAIIQSHFKAWKHLSNKSPDRVVRLLNVDDLMLGSDKAVGIFMEYMPGGNLADMVSSKWGGYPRNPDQLSKLMRLFLQVCRSVKFLHSQNVRHRDIKPSNVLLDATQTVCKLSDFEIIDHRMGTISTETIFAGTPAFMAPECFKNTFSELSDIYAMGVTLYNLLSGRLPFTSNTMHDNADEKLHQKPEVLSQLNPIIPSELHQIVMRCLAPDPAHRPQSVDDVIVDLAHAGISDEDANAAPVNLARLLLAHLSEEDRTHLKTTLAEQQGFRSSRREEQQQQADVIHEYCYTAPPHEVLADNCTNRQLTAMAKSLGLDSNKDRKRLTSSILDAVGFLPGPQDIPGLRTTANSLETQLIKLAHASTSDECSGIVYSGLASVERAVELIVRFFGQLFYGAGYHSFLSSQAGGKPWDRLTFGQKVGALRALCSEHPPCLLPDRVEKVFDWPIINDRAFTALDELVKRRNRLAHPVERESFSDSQGFARQTLSLAVEVVSDLSENTMIPRMVQIVSRQDDIYGRRYYLGKDDRDHSERIFTPLPLEVGRLYLFYPLTNPVRINPLIFPYEVVDKKS